MDFISNPALATFRDDWPGNPREGRRYREYAGDIDVSLGKVLRYMTKSNPQAAEKRQDDFRPPSVAAASAGCEHKTDLQQPGDWVCWLGHASFLIQLNGTRFLIDPVFGRLGLLRRRVEVPYTIEELGPIDYVLISHDHRDHCDEATLRQLSAAHDFTVLTSLSMADLIRPWLTRDQPIVEAGWYQRYTTPLEHPHVSFMPTQHWCRRYLHDTNRRLWGSFVLESAEHTVWFGGDSAASPHFAEVGQYFPDIDLALIGIGAYKPAWFMQGAHTSPQQAWEGFEATGAQQLFPMHYGTYDLSQEPAGEPWRQIQAFAKTANRSQDLRGGVVGQVELLG